jgi:F420H(2)-dependent biliverdin reductase
MNSWATYPVDMATRAERLRAEPNIWLATSRPTGKPHLTPIWFVFVDDAVWICTGESAVKARNMAANPLVSIALEDGNAPVVGEGVAHRVTAVPASVIAEFQRKHNWDITTDDEYQAVFRIEIAKWLHPSSGAEIV